MSRSLSFFHFTFTFTFIYYGNPPTCPLNVPLHPQQRWCFLSCVRCRLVSQILKPMSLPLHPSRPGYRHGTHFLSASLSSFFTSLLSLTLLYHLRTYRRADKTSLTAYIPLPIARRLAHELNFINVFFQRSLKVQQPRFYLTA
jgi:hypothetical protein